ncbi:MAG: glycosyltransferase [Rhodospirillales bacterium]|nr:glycosyltransferase [Rhodospirillales bacterium]
MPLIDLPARAMLKLAGETLVPWAVFDPDWYRRTYPEATAGLADASPEAVLEFYFSQGQALGHSPNALFDEAWHRRTYPGVAAGIVEGAYASAFDSYCRGGGDRSPHWLFEEMAYRRRHPDLTDETLHGAGFANGYDHFLRDGSREGRIGHAMFDSRRYVAAMPEEQRPAILARAPFRHFLEQLPSRTVPQVSAYFDPEWYLGRYPEIAAAIDAGFWLCALHHYLCNDTPRDFDPLPEFSEAYYLGRYPELVPVIDAGQFRNGYAHFLRHGALELRAPREDIDLAYYMTHEEVRVDLHRSLAADAFAHLLTLGRPAGLLTAEPVQQRMAEPQTKALFRRKAELLLPIVARSPLSFATTAPPTLAVVVVVHDKFPLTMMALASLRANHAGPIQLILVDSGSTDQTQFITRFVRGATVLRFEQNVGFLRGCNAAFQALGPTIDSVLLLNNDVELATDAVDAALRRLHGDPTIGAVGGKVVRTHGLLQEAGSIVWADGTTSGYLRDASPLAPEANFVRDVDFCSGVFLLLRADLLRALDGFDDAFAPAYYEDTDLCMRVHAAGLRVVYDPSVVIHHHEYGSATSTQAVDSAIAERRARFATRHAAALEGRRLPEPVAMLWARDAGPRRRRILFVEDQIPLRAIGSGFVRSNDILRVLASLDCAVTVYPLLPNGFDLAAVFADMPDTVEVMHDRWLDQLEAFLLARAGYYDAIWVERTHNVGRIRPMLERLGRDATVPPVILDTEALFAVREAQLATRRGETFDLDAALDREFSQLGRCAQVIAVNEAEAGLLRALGLPDPVVLGHMRPLHPTPRPFSRRAGLLFLGALHQEDSPNYDSLTWFVEDVLPLIEQSLGWETRLTVVGFQGPEVSLAHFADHPRITLRGAVENTQPLYDAHRIFVAPTRIAAGMPYKVHEAASFGLPVVATELLRQQVGWESGRDLLAAPHSDPAAFAAAVVRLYRDEALWGHLRDGALARLEQEASESAYAAVIGGVLDRVIGPI